MAGERRNLTGPPMWIKAIADAALDKSEKLVCYSLIKWINWETGGDAYPSVGTIAKACGLSTKGTAGILDRLERKGVVTYPYGRTRGGRLSNGRGITNQLELSLDRLRSLNSDPRSGLSKNADLKSTQPQPSARGTPTQGQPTPIEDHDNPNPRLDKQILEQTIEQTNDHTTTTAPDRVEYSYLVETLIEIGISRADAQDLCESRPLTADVIAFAKLQAKAAQPVHVGRFILSLLRKDPDELDGWEPYRKSMEKGRRYRRRRAYDEIMDTVRRRATPEQTDLVSSCLGVIYSVWPTLDDLVDSGALSDEELYADDIPRWDLFVKLAQAAAAPTRAATDGYTCIDGSVEIGSNHEAPAGRSSEQDEQERIDSIPDRRGDGDQPSPVEPVRAQAVGAECGKRRAAGRLSRVRDQAAVEAAEG